MTSRVALLSILLLLLTACASPKPMPLADTMALKNPPQEQPAEVRVEVSEKKDELAGLDTQQRFSLVIKDADVQDAIQLLSRQSGIPIVSDKDVTGTVTVDLKDKTIRDIIAILTKPLGFTAYMEDGVIRVGRSKLITRIFSVNYIKDKRQSTSTMNASISTSGTNDQAGGSASTTASSAGGSSSSTQGVTVSTSSTSDYWSEIIKGLETIVFSEMGGASSSGNGYSRADKKGRQLIVNQLAGVVYVRDYSDNIDNIKQFLDDVEKAVKRQVLIQAHVAEVSLNDGYSLGINWSSLLNSTFIGSDMRPLTLSQGLLPSPTSGVFQMNIQNNNVSALLDAMKEQGSLNLLSSPKIATLNNQKAVIKLTTKEVTWITNTTINSQGSVLQSSTTPQIDEVGIFLDVTPQINEKGIIGMQIHPSISEKTGISISPDGKSSKPIIDVREVDAMVEVKNNQTIVIAGLIVDKLMQTKRSVPFLGDIPYIGSLFSYTSQQKVKKELVILITPYILSDKVIADVRHEHEERLSKAKRTMEPAP